MLGGSLAGGISAFWKTHKCKLITPYLTHWLFNVPPITGCHKPWPLFWFWRWHLRMKQTMFRHINILTWPRGFQEKLLYLMLCSLYPNLFWELRDKRNLKDLQLWPKSLKATVCYNIDRSSVAYCHLIHS